MAGKADHLIDCSLTISQPWSFLLFPNGPMNAFLFAGVLNVILKKGMIRCFQSASHSNFHLGIENGKSTGQVSYKQNEKIYISILSDMMSISTVY